MKNILMGCCALSLAGINPALAQTVNLTTKVKWAPASAAVFNGGIGVKIKGVVENAAIGPAIITNASMSIWTDPSSTLRNITMDGLFIANTWREGIRVNGKADGIKITNFNIAMRAVPQTNDQMPTGIALLAGRNIVLQQGSVSGFKTTASGGYDNGDGIAAERGVDNLIISNVDSSDNTDAGFDLKSSNTVLSGLTASRNYRNFRIWGNASANTLTSTDPKNAHIWVGSGAELVIDKLVARSSTPALILYVDGAKSVTIKSCDISVPAGTKFMYLATKSSVVTLGKGCTLP